MPGAQMESCPWWHNASAAVRWSFSVTWPTQQQTSASTALEAVMRTWKRCGKKVDKKKKLNKKPAQVADKKMAGKRCEEESISLEDGRSLEGDGISLKSCSRMLK